MNTVFTIAEAAAMLRTNLKTIRNAIKSGKLKAAKIGKAYRITKHELETYFENQGGGKLMIESPYEGGNGGGGIDSGG